jgi:hypothetical protein
MDVKLLVRYLGRARRWAMIEAGDTLSAWEESIQRGL